MPAAGSHLLVLACSEVNMCSPAAGNYLVVVLMAN